MYLLLALLLLLPGGFFQKETEEPLMEPEREFEVMVENIEIVSTDPFTLRITGVHADCETPLVVEQSIQGNIVFVDINHAAVCMGEDTPFEIEVEVDTEEVEMIDSVDYQWAVVANNFPIGIQTVEDMEPAVMPLFRSPILVEDVDVIAADEGFEVRVRGQLPDGCEGQVYVRQHVDEETMQVELEITRLLSIAAMCPMMVVVYDEVFPLEGDLNGIYTVTANDVKTVYDFENQEQISMDDMTRFDTVIETAEILVQESFPPQLVLEVTGYQPDGCEFPVQVDTRQEGDTLYVDIYRLVPNNVRCPRSITPYEASISLGAFEPGEYTININNGMQTVEVEL